MVISNKANATDKNGNVKKGFKMITTSTGRIMYLTDGPKKEKVKKEKVKKVKASDAPSKGVTKEKGIRLDVKDSDEEDI